MLVSRLTSKGVAEAPLVQVTHVGNVAAGAFVLSVSKENI